MNPEEPDGSNDDDELLDALAEEFTQRFRRGETPEIDSYLGRAPHLADALRSLLETAQFLEQSRRSLQSEDDSASAIVSWPAHLGEYQLTRELGRGGMGIVCEALKPSSQRRVAIKRLLPEWQGQPVARKRFLREATLAMTVRHPHVVRIEGVGEEHSVPYLVMELVDGPSLRDYLTVQHPLSAAEVIRLSHQLAQALAAAHSHGVIHRDIKPANVLLSLDEPTAPSVKMTDFGLARAQEDASLTRSGHMMGTPQNMSPEQVNGQPADARSDLFSLGTVLYEMSAGAPAFAGETIVSVIRQIAEQNPPPLEEQRPDLPAWFVELTRCLMAKAPEDRPPGAEDVVRWIESAGAERPAQSPLANARSTGRTGRVKFWTGLAGVLTIAAVVVVWMNRPKPQPAPSTKATVTDWGRVQLVAHDESTRAWLRSHKTVTVFDEVSQQEIALHPGDNRLSAGPHQFRISENSPLRLSLSRFQLAPGTAVTAELSPASPDAGSTTAAPVNYAIQFDGRRSVIKIPTLLRGDSEPATLEAWVRTAPCESAKIIVLWGGTGRCQLSVSQDNWFSSDDSVAPRFLDTPCVVKQPLSPWTHLAYVADTDEGRLYVNGQLVAQDKRSMPYRPASSPNPPTWIGASPEPSVDKAGLHYHFRGVIDEVRMSSGTRYRHNFQPARRWEPDRETVALYHFDELSGDTLQDSSGHGHHGQIAFATWVPVGEASSE